MTKTCATCKNVSVEPMSVPYTHFYPWYSKVGKNVVFPEDVQKPVNFDMFFCQHKDRFYDDPVSGEEKSKGNVCAELRQKNSDFCGPLGKMWDKQS